MVYQSAALNQPSAPSKVCNGAEFMPKQFYKYEKVRFLRGEETSKWEKIVKLVKDNINYLDNG